jgi:hypothetical protein
MTAIIGYTDSKNIWIAADSAYSYTDSDDISYTGIHSNSKIYRYNIQLNGANTEMVIGFAGDLRFIQALIYKNMLPTTNSSFKRDVELEFIINDIIPKFEECNENTGGKGSAVIGINRRIFELDDSLAVVEPTDGLATTGSGQEVCKASFYACLSVKPEINIENALLVSLDIAHNIMPESIQPPYNIQHVTLPNPEDL